MSIFSAYGALGNYQPSDSAASGAAARANSKASSLQKDVKRLEANLAKSLMINEALWEIIRDKHNLTEQDLFAKLYEVDMRDGELDGRNQRKAAKCPSCQHMVSPRHSACLYCGHTMDQSVFTLD